MTPDKGGPVIPSHYSFWEALSGFSRTSHGHRVRMMAEDLTGTVKAPIEVRFVSSGGRLGAFSAKTSGLRVVEVAPAEPVVMVGTLAHELTHALEAMAFRQWGFEAHRFDLELPYRFQRCEGRAQATAIGLCRLLGGSAEFENGSAEIELDQMQLNAALWLYRGRPLDSITELVKKLR